MTRPNDPPPASCRTCGRALISHVSQLSGECGVCCHERLGVRIDNILRGLQRAL